ncbi:MAG: haloacid dehalogenase type II [Acidobacteria bacterium]|nr:MAG: haloacid dehalogenase type II [Acidobacteriota bacterium]
MPEPEILSFDCYGTLIDWETGLLSALAPVLARHGRSVPDEELLETFATLEAGAEQPPFRAYAVVLREVIEGLGRRFGFAPDEAERGVLAASLGDWPAFPDTRDALLALKTRYRLAIISNIDDDLFARTARVLGVEFDWVVTARQVGSYKPSLENFRQSLARFGAPSDKVLHVAQSLYHDIAPAKSLGLSTVWVNRRRGRPGHGATAPATVRPDVEVPDLRSLVVLLGVA